MGDILQTPQFQMRRLKKQLADERNNRDELELELSESLKRLTEKDAQIAMMQQRIDHLALLNEKQAASSQEPGELEELRSKNERYGSPCPSSSIQCLLAQVGTTLFSRSSSW